MRIPFLDFLSPADLPVPQDRPFTRAEALDLGLTPHSLRALLAAGLLISPLRGVYNVPTLQDGLPLRLACLRLAVPPDTVVCDRSAGWLHGAPMILAPGSHLVVPQVSLCRPPGYRLANAFGVGGERQLTATDIVEIGGLLVTTPLRTACDLGRMLHRDQAFAALDAMLRLERFSKVELECAIERFRGFRFVRRLRELAPLADGRSESPGESILRLRWLDCTDLPRPDLQVEVPGPWGTYRGDLGLLELGYIAEYDGAEHHGDEQAPHDQERRANMRDDGLIVDVFRAENIHGPRQNAELILRSGIRRALERRRRAS